MSEAFKCDICGKLYEYSGVITLLGPEIGNIEKDLCPECGKKVKEFIETLSDHDKEDEKSKEITWNPISSSSHKDTMITENYKPIYDKKIAKLRDFIIKNGYKNWQAFNSRNIVGDDMCTEYDDQSSSGYHIKVDVCHDWEYLEIFGLTNDEWGQLTDILRVSFKSYSWEGSYV